MRNIFFTLCTLLPCLLYSQAPIATQTNVASTSKTKFIQVGAGFDNAYFTDFATSALPYSTSAMRFDLAFLRSSARRETKMYFGFSSATFKLVADQQTFGSTVNTPYLAYTRLYQVPLKLGEKWNFKLGASLDITGNMRMNPGLQNNAFGLEMFNTLFGSAKMSYDISRKKEKQGRFLLISYHLKPKTRILSYQLNLPLMNNTYRNGYAYTNASTISNQTRLTDGYQYHAFSGFRMSSALHYDLYYPNGNILRLGYHWDAYRTAGDFDRFQMAHHYFQLALLFKTN